MKNLLIYYGWLNSFNSATNSWNNESVAQELAQYNLLVFGDGIQSSTHGDYSNTSVIIPRIKALNTNSLIFGYVTVNQTFANFKTKVDEWDTLNVHGIFMDEAGYDYGSSSTNSREEFNRKVDYIHSKDMNCFANAWKIQHVLGIENDASYPNTSWNPNLVESNLYDSDWYLMESFAINSSGNYESKTQWKSRGDECAEYEEEYGINLAACSVISDSDSAGQSKFNFIYTSACMFSIAAVGSSDTNYGASSANSKMWTRPNVYHVVNNENIYSVNVQLDVSDSDVYHRYFNKGRMKVDFSSGFETSTIEDYL